MRVCGKLPQPDSGLPAGGPGFRFIVPGLGVAFRSGLSLKAKAFESKRCTCDPPVTLSAQNRPSTIEYC